MLDRLRVRTLVEAGHPQGRTAHLVGVRLSSVQRILLEPAFDSADAGPTPQSPGAAPDAPHRAGPRARNTLE